MAGHHFDRAKQGYWSLLQPQDRKSKNPGDSEAAVLARQSWLARGYMSGLIQALQPWVSSSQSNETGTTTRTLDLGCGEGTFGKALFTDEADGYCGIDLSRRAIKLAARSWPEATWVLSNADRFLPAADESVDRVISLFGRRPATEIRRVLQPTGVCMVAVPGEEDLIELRQHVQSEGHRRSRWELIAEEMSAAGLELSGHQSWREQFDLDRQAIVDSLTMTYRGNRHSQAERISEIASMSVTLAADLLLFRRRD
ncbi:methyltransferase domain-containing protein [Stieleria marina]|uniref:methyltransferase domain-containing protein n=1 Tax=Stieleria marina TaxID=1930275 RepID=UPI003AF3E396